MGANQISKFNFILLNIMTDQYKTQFRHLHTVLSFLSSSNSQRKLISPFFHLCGSEQTNYIKVEFNENSVEVMLLNKFEETMYHVKPIFTSMRMIKNGEIEEFKIEETGSLRWSPFKQQKYFNSIGFFEIQFTIYYSIIPIFSFFVSTKSTLHDCLLNMYTERKFTDVVLIVENKKYSAHKSILARSPVFKAMFQHEMQEKYQDVVTIEGIESKIFDIILKFLYVGEINDINEIIKFDNKKPKQWKLANILKAADMYQIDDMKVLLGDIASKYINIDNVAYFLAVATEYNTYNLTYSCVSFIKNCGSQICNNKKFKEIITVSPTVALRLLNYLLKK